MITLYKKAYLQNNARIRHYWASETNDPNWQSLCGLKRHSSFLHKQTHWPTERDCYRCRAYSGKAWSAEVK